MFVTRTWQEYWPAGWNNSTFTVSQHGTSSVMKHSTLAGPTGVGQDKDDQNTSDLTVNWLFWKVNEIIIAQDNPITLIFSGFCPKHRLDAKLRIWNSYNSITDEQETSISYMSSKECRHAAAKYTSSLQSDFSLGTDLDIYHPPVAWFQNHVP